MSIETFKELASEVSVERNILVAIVRRETGILLYFLETALAGAAIRNNSSFDAKRIAVRITASLHAICLVLS